MDKQVARVPWRDRCAPPALLFATAFACFSVGMILLTHASYASWDNIGAPAMDAVHREWGGVVDMVIHPMSVASAIGAAGIVVFRHRLVPWWLIGVGIAQQVATFTTTYFMWSQWQHTIGELGTVRTPEGALHPVYVQVMDTHWIRIALVCGYALTTLVMLGIVLLRRTERVVDGPARAAVPAG